MKMRNKCSGMGLRPTPQRLAILECLEGNRRHPSAEEIYGTVRKRYPAMSFATVYNTLQALVKKGGIVELTIDPGRRRYDPDTEPHNHMICVLCGRVVDVHINYSLDLPRDARQGFRVTGSHVEFHGFCPECKRR
ncbi:MAG: transcriptional repressor [Nitrospiraceae bacterium]|nr:transcriptional repressor [Nitrospiraceae bacterium]